MNFTLSTALGSKIMAPHGISQNTAISDLKPHSHVHLNNMFHPDAQPVQLINRLPG